MRKRRGGARDQDPRLRPKSEAEVRGRSPRPNCEREAEAEAEAEPEPVAEPVAEAEAEGEAEREGELADVERAMARVRGRVGSVDRRLATARVRAKPRPRARNSGEASGSGEASFRGSISLPKVAHPSGLRIPWAGSRNPPERRRARKSPALPGDGSSLGSRRGLWLYGSSIERVRPGGFRGPGASGAGNRLSRIRSGGREAGTGKRKSRGSTGRTDDPASRAVGGNPQARSPRRPHQPRDHLRVLHQQRLRLGPRHPPHHRQRVLAHQLAPRP